jgi:hypothetical protein
LTAEPAGQNELAVRQTLDTRDFVKPNQLAAGDKLQLAVKASDCCQLGQGPNIGSSQYFVLQVVTPADLRTRLDRRELQLRQRFENLVAEMVETRDLMARIATRPPDPPESTPAATGGAESLSAAPSDGSAASATTPRAARKDQSPAAHVRRRLQLARVTQNINRTGYEILDVATAFDEIQAELINNRIATETHLKRLREGIAEPLKQVAEQMLPAVLDRLQAAPLDPASASQGAPALTQAIAQADAVLVELRRILARMIELESYNEVLEQLRAIIQDQARLIDETSQRRKAQVRSLLED